MYKRILIAIDASELSHRGLFQGLELAKATGAKVDIVTVSEPWAMGMYDAMGWSVGYEASPEYRTGREAAAEKSCARRWNWPPPPTSRPRHGMCWIASLPRASYRPPRTATAI